MAQTNEKPYIQVIRCAISNSIDYKQDKPVLIEKRIDMLKDCAIRFISEEGHCSQSEALVEYNKCLETALCQKRSVGKYPLWVWLGLFIGIFCTIVNGISAIATWFNLAMVIFLIVSISMISWSINYMIANEKLRRASKIWNRSFENDIVVDHAKVLEDMKKILQ